MHICPHCSKPGIGVIRKHFIGMKVPATCKNCGGEVFNDNKKAIVAVIPFVLSYIASRYIASTELAYAVIAIGAITMLLLTSFWVPLVKK